MDPSEQPEPGEIVMPKVDTAVKVGTAKGDTAKGDTAKEGTAKEGTVKMDTAKVDTIKEDRDLSFIEANSCTISKKMRRSLQAMGQSLGDRGIGA